MRWMAERAIVRGAKSTKCDAARRIPIEPNLLPLLQAMRQEVSGRGPVLRLAGDGGPAKLRMYLKRAGVKRADLFTTDATRKAITFHDLRATGMTWCAVRGDEPLKIMQRAGHSDFETTKISSYGRPRTSRAGSGFRFLFSRKALFVLAVGLAQVRTKPNRKFTLQPKTR